MQMLNYRTMNEQENVPINDDNDQSWRIRYMGLLCMSQIYKHLQSQPRHKTLSNFLWVFIHQYEKREQDDRVTEALKVGRVRNILSSSYFQTCYILSINYSFFLFIA